MHGGTTAEVDGKMTELDGTDSYIGLWIILLEVVLLPVNCSLVGMLISTLSRCSGILWCFLFIRLTRFPVPVLGLKARFSKQYRYLALLSWTVKWFHTSLFLGGGIMKSKTRKKLF